MAQSKSTDHWRQLAQLLGAALPDEPAPVQAESLPEPPLEPLPEPEPVPAPSVAPIPPAAFEPEPTPPVPVLTPSLSPIPVAAFAAEPASSAPVVAAAAPAIVAEKDVIPEMVAPVAVVAEPPTAPRAPTPSPAVHVVKPVPDEVQQRQQRQANHWDDLARQLGIEVPPLEEPAESEMEPQREPEPPSAPITDFSWEEVPPPEEPAVDDVMEADRDSLSEPDRGGRALFEDPNLSVETPGVLDSVFDEEPELAYEDESDLVPRSWDEAATSELPEAEAAPLASDAEGEGEEDRPARRRRRRRGRRRRSPGETERESAVPEELDEAVPEDDLLDDEREAEEVADLDTDEGEETRPRQRGRRRWRTAEDQPAEDEEAEVSEEEVEEDLVPIGSRVERLEPDQDQDDDLDAGLDEDDAEVFHIKHRNIPTWDEAIGLVIATNMESRAKNPGGHSRGRGRGRPRS
jgi:ribonuclease E